MAPGTLRFLNRLLSGPRKQEASKNHVAAMGRNRPLDKYLQPQVAIRGTDSLTIHPST